MDALFNENEVINVSSVWQQFFGKPMSNGSKTIYSPDSEVIDIDIMRGQEKVAALIHRGTDSRHLNKQKNTELSKYSTFSRVFPFAEELGDITASQINKRVGGENPYERRSKNDRMRSYAREYHNEHIRRYVRLFEILAGLSVLGGQHPAITGSENTENWYDFRRNAAHIASPDIPWDNEASDKLGDIDAACRLLRENGKVKPNVIFFGQNVFPLFIADITVQAQADNRRFELIQVSTNNPVPPKFDDLVAAGAIARGLLRTPEGFEMWMFTYIDIYEDEDGDAQHYMPLNSCLIAYYGARCDRYFGPSEVLPPTPQDAAWYQQMFGMNMLVPMMPVNIKNPGATVTPAMFHCDAYPTEDKKKVTVRTQSAPIFATTQTDAFFTYSDMLEVSS
jgi:hypothetical protein